MQVVAYKLVIYIYKNYMQVPTTTYKIGRLNNAT